MAGIDGEDCTDSPAIKITNEPQEIYFPMWAPDCVEPRRRSSPDELGVAKEREKMESCNNNGKTAGSLVEAAQKKELEKWQEQRTRTIQDNCGRARPNVDEEVCEKKDLKIGDIDPGVFGYACGLLDVEQVLGGDWRSLGGKLGYTVRDVKIFETKENKAKCMLYHWDNKSDHYLQDLVTMLRGMERDDVASLLQKEIDKKGDECNCPECGHIV